MKIKSIYLISTFILAGYSSFGAEPAAKDCPPAQAPNTLPIAAALQVNECEAQGSLDSNEPLLTKLASEHQAAGKVLKFLPQPTSRTSSSFVYHFDKEVECKPGEYIYMGVPKDLAKRNIRMVNLSHRQIKIFDPNDPEKKILNKDWDPNKGNGGWDNVPAYTSLQFHTSDPKFSSDPWRCWGGDASTKCGGKFAEYRDESQGPEIETLYAFKDASHAGHYGLSNADKYGGRTGDPLAVDAVRAYCPGPDVVQISDVTVYVDPLPGEKAIVQSFSKTPTEFGDTEEAKQKFGGGQEFGGRFPGALPLKNSDSPYWYNRKYLDKKLPQEKQDEITAENELRTKMNKEIDAALPEVLARLPKGWRYENRKLIIPLPPGSNVLGLEVAVGDSYPDDKPNSDGGTGTQGHARFKVTLRKKNGGEDVLMGHPTDPKQNANVPPQGFLSGSPKNTCYATQAGDELVLESYLDVAYLMGLKINLRDAKK